MRNFETLKKSAELNYQLFELTQLGAKITILPNKTCYIKFNLKNIVISYVYIATKHDKYFLTRIKPYSMPMDEVDSEHQLIAIIIQDIQLFENAIKSSNIKNFLKINNQNFKNSKLLENLFLHYNVDKKTLDEINSKLLEIEDIINNSKKSSNKIEI